MGGWNRWWLLMTVCALLTLWVRPVHGEAGEDVASGWSQQSLQIQAWVQEGGEEGYLKARDGVAALADSFSRADFSETDISVQGIRALSDSLVELEGQLNRVMPQTEELDRASEQSALAFDALAHPNQPLWHQYEPVFKEDIQAVKSAVKKGGPDEVRTAVQALVSHVERVKPALEVSRKPETVGKVQSVLQFLRSQSQKEKPSSDALVGAVGQWERMIPPLFYGPEEEVAAFGGGQTPPVLPASVVLGSVIAGILCYVGWRNYRYGLRKMARRL